VSNRPPFGFTRARSAMPALWPRPAHRGKGLIDLRSGRSHPGSSRSASAQRVAGMGPSSIQHRSRADHAAGGDACHRRQVMAANGLGEPAARRRATLTWLEFPAVITPSGLNAGFNWRICRGQAACARLRRLTRFCHPSSHRQDLLIEAAILDRLHGAPDGCGKAYSSSSSRLRPHLPAIISALMRW